MLTPALILLATLASPQEEAVHRAKLAAIQYLVDQQLPDGTWVLPGNERFTHAGSAFLGFALLRAGLPAEHLSIWRVDELLRQTPPRSTYDASVRVHFLDALQPPDLESRLKRAAHLLALPRADYFGYGYANTIPHGDLSNHQFALLALEILDRYQLGPSRKQWEEMTEFLIRLQQPDGGWGYFQRSETTPTMHLAGLACLAACQRALARNHARKSTQRDLATALERGFQQAGAHWYLQADRSRAPLKRWIHYAGATLERAASLTDREQVGEHDWHEEIAAFLVETQHARGSWSAGSGEPVLNTGLALATLARASAATGGGSTQPWRPRWISSSEAVRLVATGTSPCTAFVSSLQGDLAGWAIQSASWTLEGEPLAAGAGHRATIQFPLTENGDYSLQASLELVHPETGEIQSRVESLPLSVRGLVGRKARDRAGWRQERASADVSELESLEVSASIGGPSAVYWLFDASWATSWRWKKNSVPYVSLRFDESVRSRAIRLIPHLRDSNAMPGEISPFEVRVNGSRVRRDPTIDAAGVYYPLSRAKKIRTLQIRWSGSPDHETSAWVGIREVQFIAP